LLIVGELTVKDPIVTRGDVGVDGVDGVLVLQLKAAINMARSKMFPGKRRIR
jgi:hypothetical protein